MIVCKVLRTSRVVFCASSLLQCSFPHRICLDYAKQATSITLDIRKMSQKSITSFFKRTPKKEAEGNEDEENRVS